jgi:AcrR family transcriptional regulator
MAKRGRAIGQTRQRIERGLIRLVASQPYGAITMADIAAEADVSERTVQRHYRSKDSLLVEACLRGPLGAMSEELSKDSGAHSAEEAVRRLVQALFAFYDQHDRECWALHNRAVEVPEVQQAVRAANETRESHVQAFIDRRPDAWRVDRESATHVILALTSYLTWRSFSEFTDLPTPQAATLVADLLCDSLVRQSDAPGACGAPGEST